MPLSPEVIDDRVATVLNAGTNVTLNYDDAANVLTISATPGGAGTYTDEQAQDAVGNIIADSTTIDFLYNDATPSISGFVKDNSITEPMLNLVDNTTKNSSTTAHGLLPKLPGGTTTFLRGDGTWIAPPTGTTYTNEDAQDAVGTILTDTATIDFTYNDAANTIIADVRDASITEAKMLLSDITTQNVNTARHGLVPKAPNSSTQYLDGTGVWSTPAGGASYTDEQAQDAVGAMLVDTATIDLTYIDATPALTASVIAGSIGTTQLANSSVTYAKLQNVSATDRVLGRSTAGAGIVEEIVCTPFARTVLDDTTQLVMRATLGLDDEAIQDLVALLLTNSNFIKFVYNDASAIIVAETAESRFLLIGV